MAGRSAPALGFLAMGAVLALALARAYPNLDLAAPLAPEGAGPVAAAAGAQPSPRLTLLVVIDGLRADVAATLPFLSQLADGGARAWTLADPPTISSAQYVALLAGVPPRDSGVRTNESLRAAGVDDVALRARAAGLHTAVVSTGVDWWQRLFPRSFESADLVPTARVVGTVAPLLARGGFVVVHLCGVDDAGHAFGARSAEYAGAAAAADQLTAALAQAAGPRANVVVTADHGHRPRGGHGGEEPDVRASFVIAAGPDVQPGARVDGARSVDVAATLAALRGVPAPGAATGRTLVDLLRVSPARRGALTAADAARIPRVAAATATARAAAAAAQRRARITRAIAVAILAALLIARLRPPLRAFGRGLIALAATAAVYTSLFGPPSLSAARKAFLWVAALAAIAFAATVPALWLGARRREGMRSAIATVAALALPAAVAFVYAGLFAARLECEPGWLAAGPACAYAILAGACGAGAARCMFMPRA
ncbi:MAG TPA: alkaline phosphatase family protein [Polyangia bacterium]|jgi:hypothetical protein